MAFLDKNYLVSSEMFYSLTKASQDSHAVGHFAFTVNLFQNVTKTIFITRKMALRIYVLMRTYKLQGLLGQERFLHRLLLSRYRSIARICSGSYL